ncbi:MAG: mechanosensitive ion channel family protein [Chthoniobacteraceae bacterium]
MNFWKYVEEASGIQGGLSRALLFFLIAVFIIYHFRPAERDRIRSSLALFIISFAGILLSAGMLEDGMPVNHWIYLVVHGASLFILAASIVNVTSIFLFSVALRAVRLEPPHIAQDLLVGLAYVAIALALLSMSGIDLRGIVATSAVITAVIGFSLQDSLGNIIGGTFLQVEQMIRVGDWIRVDDVEGRVTETRWRQTSIETRNWDTVVIPNALLVKGKVTVIGRRRGAPLQHRRWIYFQVSLSHPPSEVIETVDSALLVEPIRAVSNSPELHCLLTDMKNGDGTYAVRYWLTDLAHTDVTDSLIRTRIFAALHRANIELAIPSQSILFTEETSHREILKAKEIAQRVWALRNTELFRSLTDDERDHIAERLVNALFVKGEAITQQGAEAHWLYLMTEGEADVKVLIDGTSRQVATLKAGDYFGEMGLMTGEPRTATVVARTAVKCYRLSKEGFQEILRGRPEIADEISGTLAYRRMGLNAAREEANEEVMRDRMKATQKAFLLRMRDFFGLVNA